VREGEWNKMTTENCNNCVHTCKACATDWCKNWKKTEKEVPEWEKIINTPMEEIILFIKELIANAVLEYDREIHAEYIIERMEYFSGLSNKDAYREIRKEALNKYKYGISLLKEQK